MRLEGQVGHLGYSTLVHTSDTWPELWNALLHYVPMVREGLKVDTPFGLSLRMSGETAVTLLRSTEERTKLRDYLKQRGFYVYTVNAFPYGAFKGRTVGEQVYEPDWSESERLRYTAAVADVLGDLIGEVSPEIQPSIQSVPLGFCKRLVNPGTLQQATFHVLSAVAHLVELERRTGVCIRLALEPEPSCVLERTMGTIKFFEQNFYARGALDELSRLVGVSRGNAEDLIRRHLGVVFDVCHQTVLFEDPVEGLRALRLHGIPVFKLQLACGLLVHDVTQDAIDALQPFTRTIYLTQTVERRGGMLRYFLNLSRAIDAWRADPDPDREWRVHIHLPVFLDRIGPLSTSRPMLEATLRFHLEDPVTDHLEIETYTWDVLPEHVRGGDVTAGIVRELAWARGYLSDASWPDGAALVKSVAASSDDPRESRSPLPWSSQREEWE